LALITTDILTLDEYCERRKLGRTSVFNRVKSGQYIDSVDYIRDGSEMKFYWPCREMIARDQKLRQMGLFSDLLINQKGEFEFTASHNPAKELVQQATAQADTLVKEKTARNKREPAVTKITKRRPAFIL